MRMKDFSGFTLIELMIVVVVIAILVAVAYPSYQDHVRKAKRAEGKAALLKGAQLLERWYSDKNTYGTTPPPPNETSIDLALLFGLAANATVYSGENPSDATSAYKVTAAVGACGDLKGCFLLTATPQGGFVDGDCGNLTLSSTGARDWSTSGTPSTVSKCKW
jgi:type IV pilus assembly protein PilE